MGTVFTFKHPSKSEKSTTGDTLRKLRVREGSLTRRLAEIKDEKDSLAREEAQIHNELASIAFARRTVLRLIRRRLGRGKRM